MKLNNRHLSTRLLCCISEPATLFLQFHCQRRLSCSRSTAFPRLSSFLWVLWECWPFGITARCCCWLCCSSTWKRRDGLSMCPAKSWCAKIRLQDKKNPTYVILTGSVTRTTKQLLKRMKTLSWLAVVATGILLPLAVFISYCELG